MAGVPPPMDVAIRVPGRWSGCEARCVVEAGRVEEDAEAPPRVQVCRGQGADGGVGADGAPRPPGGVTGATPRRPDGGRAQGADRRLGPPGVGARPDPWRKTPAHRERIARRWRNYRANNQKRLRNTAVNTE